MRVNLNICDLAGLFMCEWVKLLQCLHQNKVSVEHNRLFVSDFDFFLLMDVIVGEKWLCTDLHSGACLDGSVTVASLSKSGSVSLPEKVGTGRGTGQAVGGEAAKYSTVHASSLE